MEAERLLSISRLKEHTGLSESGIRRLVRQGVIPAVRIGRRILFKPSSIARFLDQRETGGDIPAKRRPKSAPSRVTAARGIISKRNRQQADLNPD